MSKKLKDDAPIRFLGNVSRMWAKEELVLLIDDVISERIKRLRAAYEEQENK